jgi:tRNA dimethylallyltransferase
MDESKILVYCPVKLSNFILKLLVYLLSEKNQIMSNYDLLVITGPTASGKTSLAAAVAERIDSEIISADSRQVYKEMNIGTGKDYKDYIVSGRRIPVHLIDIVDPGYKYNVFEYQRDFLKVYEEIRSRDKIPVVCGGSGLYIDSIISGYKLIEVPPDHEFRKDLEKKEMDELTSILKSFRHLHNKTDIDTRKRVIRAIEIEKYYQQYPVEESGFPETSALVVAVNFDRETLRNRITYRLRERLANGMIEEVKGLLERGIEAETMIYYGLEYKYITLYLTGKLTYEEMYRSLEIAIHQYAKRQRTWFRGMERRGIKIHWLDGNLPAEDKVGQIINMLNS